MSRWDEFDRMFERMEEGLSRMEANKDIVLNYRDIDADRWEAGKKQIMKRILDGERQSNHWRIKGTWVEIFDGYLKGTSFFIPNEEGGQEWLAKQNIQHIRLVDSQPVESDEDHKPSSVLSEKNVVESNGLFVIKRKRERKLSNIEVLQSLKEQLQRK